MMRFCVALVFVIGLSVASESSGQILRRRSGGCSTSGGCNISSSGCNVSSSGCNLSAAVPAAVAVPASVAGPVPLPAQAAQSLFREAAGAQPAAPVEAKPSAPEPGPSDGGSLGVDARSAMAFCSPVTENLIQPRMSTVMLAAFGQR